jgi:hypothetical protein
MAQANVVAPRLPNAPEEYDSAMLNQTLNILRLYFRQLDNPGPIVASGLSFTPTPGTATPSLPTQASLATLRVGDIYYDTTAGNVLKVKV